MAVYKIPQDVEADDKFVGPLSFKQFIFAGIAAVAGYLSFISISKGFGIALIVLLPIVIIGGFLGFPWGRDQPTEIWLAARIRFFIKPRVRIWNQSGIKDLVTITAPKKIEKNYTNGLTQNEVQSRLNGLATLIDSRGWAIKNATQDAIYNNQVVGSATDDRLVDVASVLPQEVSDSAHATDILDESSNSTAIHFDEMIKQSEQKHRQEVMQHMQDAINTPQPQQQTQATPQQGADFWFLNGTDAAAPAQQQAPPAQQAAAVQQQPAYTTFNQALTVAPQTQSSTAQQLASVLQDTASAQVTQADEEALLKKVHDAHQNPAQQFGHLHTIQPIGQQDTSTTTPPPTTTTPVTQQQPQNAVTTPVDPAIINLASNDDLNVETIARQAHQQTDSNDGEVVISLH